MATATLPMVETRTTTTVVAPGRVLSVDVLRGLTIALMILVNNPGDWEHVFKQLDHAEWNGWTLTDLVFPNFLFLMGASMVFSLSARAANGNCRKTQAGHIVLRSAKIFGLSLFLSFFPRMNWTRMRLFGVLPRIAICYLIAGLLLLLVNRRWKAIVGMVAALLVGYWVVMRFVPVPGVGVPTHDVEILDPVNNWAAWVDRHAAVILQKTVHAGRLYKKTSDPEGLFSTLTAVATTLLGSLAGLWMRRPIGWRRIARGLVFAGVVGIVAGMWWGRTFPINKNLWTSSYVLLAAGWSALGLGVCSWLIDRHEGPRPKWVEWLCWPWLVFGSNAIAAFTISTLLVEYAIYFKLKDPAGGKHSLWELYYYNVFAHGGVSTYWTSLAFAVAFVVVNFLPVWFLWRKRIFLRL